MEDSRTVIGAVGFNGSGKDTLIAYLHDQYDLPVVSMGDIVREMATRAGEAFTRTNLHQISQDAIEQYGADFFAHKAIAQIEEESWKVVGITGIRSPEDVEAYREYFGEDFVLVGVQVGDARLRFERVEERDEDRDPQSYEKFLRKDREEWDLFRIAETIKLVDITIDNDGTLEEFHQQIEEKVVKPVLGHNG